MPEETLLAVADHGTVAGVMPVDGGNAEATLAAFAQAGVDVTALAARLQTEGAEAFVASWTELLACIADKSASLRRAG
jgi:transaldolase